MGHGGGQATVFSTKMPSPAGTVAPSSSPCSRTMSAYDTIIPLLRHGSHVTISNLLRYGPFRVDASKHSRVQLHGPRPALATHDSAGTRIPTLEPATHRLATGDISFRAIAGMWTTSICNRTRECNKASALACPLKKFHHVAHGVHSFHAPWELFVLYAQGVNFT